MHHAAAGSAHKIKARSARKDCKFGARLPACAASRAAGAHQKMPRCVQALYAVEAADAGQLSFAAGDIIEIIKEGEPNGWWEGRIGEQLGWFPSSFCGQPFGLTTEASAISADGEPSQQPPALPDGWLEMDDGAGNTYYYHTPSGESVWERPVAEDATAMAEQATAVVVGAAAVQEADAARLAAEAEAKAAEEARLAAETEAKAAEAEAKAAEAVPVAAEVPAAAAAAALSGSGAARKGGLGKLKSAGKKVVLVHKLGPRNTASARCKAEMQACTPERFDAVPVADEEAVRGLPLILTQARNVTLIPTLTRCAAYQSISTIRSKRQPTMTKRSPSPAPSPLHRHLPNSSSKWTQAVRATSHSTTSW